MRMVIDGLTDRQTQLCDMLWACDTQAEVKELLDNLYEPERTQAQTLMQIMLQEAAEEQLKNMSTFYDAEALLKKIKKD